MTQARERSGQTRSQSLSSLPPLVVGSWSDPWNNRAREAEKRDPGNEVEEWGGDGSVEHNHKQICTLKMSFIPICYSSLTKRPVTVHLK